MTSKSVTRLFNLDIHRGFNPDLTQYPTEYLAPRRLFGTREWFLPIFLIVEKRDRGKYGILDRKLFQLESSTWPWIFFCQGDTGPYTFFDVDINGAIVNFSGHICVPYPR